MATAPENIAKVRQVLNDLIQEGDSNRIFSYLELEKLTGVQHHTEALTVLGEISMEHFAEHRLLVSSLVVSKATSFPGAGYFKLAQELGLFPKKESIGEYIGESFLPSVAAAEFWRGQRGELFRQKPFV